MSKAENILVAVDIGHGENTWEAGGGKGVRKNGKVYEEHHFNSAVGQLVDKRLKEHGFKTYLAQQPYKNDVPLATRSRNYNRQKVDLVVSIHANAGVPIAKGACIFYWHTSKNGKRFADIWKNNFKSMVDGVGLHGTGQHQSMRGSWTNFHIVRETTMPSVLIEHGFMTNDHDFEYIFGSKKEKYIEQVAEVIVKSVCEYFGVSYKKDTTPVKVVEPDRKGQHKIQRGDTFYSLAKKYGVSVQAIQKANPNVNPRALQVGSWINIPSKSVKPKGDQKTKSIVDYLDSIGVDSSFENRKKLASQHGIKNYSGTASQNLNLLKKIRGH